MLEPMFVRAGGRRLSELGPRNPIGWMLWSLGFVRYADPYPERRPPDRLISAVAAVLAVLFLATAIVPTYIVLARDRWVLTEGAAALGTTDPQRCSRCDASVRFAAEDGRPIHAILPDGPFSATVQVRYPPHDPSAWVVTADDDLLSGASGFFLALSAGLAWFASVAGVVSVAARRGRQLGLVRPLIGVAVIIGVVVSASQVLPLRP